MSTICFVTYEIHPTTWGGCGVLLHHAAERLLRDGHEIVFLLDIPHDYFVRFDTRDRLAFPNAERCRAYHVDTLCADHPITPDEVPGTAMWKSVRFAHAVRQLRTLEPDIDFIEFFEYCGVAYHTLMQRLFDEDPAGPVIGCRLHNSIELIDTFGSTRLLDEDRYLLYRLEHAALQWSEATLTPTQTYFESYYRDRYRLDADGVVVSQSPKLDFPRVTRRPGSDGQFRIVYVGRVMQFKGVDQLVRAGVELFTRRPELDAVIDLIGPDNRESPLGGSYVEYLKTLIPPKLRDRFEFTGHLSHDELAERLNDALFGVFPNKFESFCYALHEVYDAGVPVVINDLPGFADFFRHEENALIYDGSTRELVHAMERLIDDEALRERLASPYPIATDPLGSFYASPHSLQPVVSSNEFDGFESVAVILCEAGTGSEAASRTLRTLDEQTSRFTDVIALEPSDGSSGETLWWLGRAWRALDQSGASRAVGSLTTRDGLVTLNAGDELEPRWLETMRRAMRRRNGRLAFASTWTADELSEEASLLDVAPEILPFQSSVRLMRALLRTERGQDLADLFEADLGALGEIAYMWKSVERWGRGAVAPQVMLRRSAEPALDVQPALLQSLMIRHGAIFRDELALYAAILEGQLRETRQGLADPAREPAVEPRLLPDVSVDYRFRLADELGGRTLLRMALRKAAKRMLRQPPTDVAPMISRNGGDYAPRK